MIEVHHLTKKYGDHVAVKDLNFFVKPGKIYGFLGPNGAGKSTTMNILTGCLAPTEGQVLIGGFDISEEPQQAKRFIGYLPEQPPVYPEMTPREYLDFVGRAKGLTGAELRSQMEEVAEDTQITSMLDRLIKNLSKGYRQRVGIAQAMLGHPEVIILDEPTVGLDPQQIIYIRSLIKRLGKKQTVILSSHILSEIAAICDYVMIIAHGQLVASDTLENLSNGLAGERTLDMTVRGNADLIRMELNDIAKVTSYDINPSAEGKGGIWDIRIRSEQKNDIRESVFFAMAKHRFPLLRMVPEIITLEDVFLRLTADPGGDYDSQSPLQPHESFSDASFSDAPEEDDLEDEDPYGLPAKHAPISAEKRASSPSISETQEPIAETHAAAEREDKEAAPSSRHRPKGKKDGQSGKKHGRDNSDYTPLFR